LEGKLFVPPILSVAPFAILISPPVVDVPRLAVNVERSRVPLLTRIFPRVDKEEYNEGRLPARVFVVPAPLMTSVE
jgi:hypothetical protein